MYRGVYSEFEVREQSIKIGDSEGFKSMNCIGSSNETLNTRIITKKCRGTVEREKVRGDGTGTLEQSLHVPAEIYNEVYAMGRNGLAEGVFAYGRESVHPEFAIVQKVMDEDDEVKYKAYPRCVIETGPNRPVENGATEVPELSLTIALLPDENGECMYEALASALAPEIASKWMTDFTPELIAKANVPTA